MTLLCFETPDKGCRRLASQLGKAYQTTPNPTYDGASLPFLPPKSKSKPPPKDGAVCGSMGAHIIHPRAIPRARCA